MIEIFKSKRDGLHSIEKVEKGCWVNVTSPDEEDIARIKEMAKIPDEFLDYIKDPDEQPRSEKERGVIFIVMRAPKENPGDELEFLTTPVGIFILRDFFITISYGKSYVIKKLKEQRINTNKRVQTVLRLFLITSRNYLDNLKRINRKSILIQKDLEKNMRNEELIELMKLEKSLIYFNTSIRSNGILTEKLVSNKLFTTFEEDKELLDDVIIETRQAFEMTKIYTNILDSVMNTSASVISNKLNKTMKFLTSITIILMIPTLIASVYGMNIDLPFQNSEYAFIITMLMSAFFLTVGIIFFSKRDFF